MAGETNTGTDKQELKRLLGKATKESPINCAFGLDKDPNTALLMVDKVKGPKAVEKELTNKFPDAKNTRFGTAFEDAENPKLIKITVNKPVSSMARKLIKTLKGTGYNKVEILLDDGTVMESAGDEEAAPVEAGETPEGETQEAQTDAPTGGAPPPPPPMPQQAPQPDAAELTRLLTEQVKRIPRAMAVTPTLKDTLTKLATGAQVNLKTGNLAYAATAIEQLRHALDAAPQGPAPSGAPTEMPQATARAPEGAKVTLMKSRMAWMAARKRVEGDIDRLGAEILATYKASPVVGKIDTAYRARAGQVLEAFGETLAEHLEAAGDASDPTERARQVGEAVKLLTQYRQQLAGDETITELDANPFLPLKIRATLGDTIETLAKLVR